MGNYDGATGGEGLARACACRNCMALPLALRVRNERIQGDGCRVARVGHSTADYHLKNDLDFAALAEGAKDYADDLLHTRCLQRCIEGDIEPVVGHIQKFDTHLQIEMLRAHLPSTFKTPGQGGNINIKDSNVLVMTEEMRAKLMAANRERIMALPDSFDMLAARVATLQESQSHESQ